MNVKEMIRRLIGNFHNAFSLTDMTVEMSYTGFRLSYD